MKKALIASLLGIAASAMTTFGQGSISFDNYLTFSSTGAPLWLGNPGTPLPVGAQVQIFYQLGTAADPIATGTLLASTAIGSGGVPAGYYNGGSVGVANYVSGNISFRVQATYNGEVGRSSTLTLSSIATGATPPTSLDIPSFVVPIPEPSTFALAGLGSAALLIFRRRK